MKQFGILSLGSRLKRLSDFLYSEVQAVYTAESLMISSTYFPILRLLQAEESLSVVEISECLGLSHPAVSKQVAKMLKEQLLLKVQDEADQRRSLIQLSELCRQEMKKAEPVLEVIGAELEFYLNQQSGSFVGQLAGLEEQLLNGPYAKRVLFRLHPEQLVIKHCESANDFFAFKDLNRAWLEKFFAHDIYDKDARLLDSPQTEIIAKGGVVKVAYIDDCAVATYFILPNEEYGFELGKLAVAEPFQALGLGERMLKDALGVAKSFNAPQIMLESHTSLTPALNLYRKLGFEMDSSAKPYSVPRANIRMIKTLD